MLAGSIVSGGLGEDPWQFTLCEIGLARALPKANEWQRVSRQTELLDIKQQVERLQKPAYGNNV